MNHNHENLRHRLFFLQEEVFLVTRAHLDWDSFSTEIFAHLPEDKAQMQLNRLNWIIEEAKLSGFDVKAEFDKNSDRHRRRTTHRPLHEIAREIRADWTDMPVTRSGYVNALANLTNVDEVRYGESGEQSVRDFLEMSKQWTGPVAEKIKNELKEIIRK